MGGSVRRAAWRKSVAEEMIMSGARVPESLEHANNTLHYSRAASADPSLPDLPSRECGARGWLPGKPGRRRRVLRRIVHIVLQHRYPVLRQRMTIEHALATGRPRRDDADL